MSLKYDQTELEQVIRLPISKSLSSRSCCSDSEASLSSSIDCGIAEPLMATTIMAIRSRLQANFIVWLDLAFRSWRLNQRRYRKDRFCDYRKVCINQVNGLSLNICRPPRLWWKIFFACWWLMKHTYAVLMAITLK